MKDIKRKCSPPSNDAAFREIIKVEQKETNSARNYKHELNVIKVWHKETEIKGEINSIYFENWIFLLNYNKLSS